MRTPRRILDLRAGEARPFGRLALVFGLLVAGHTMLETMRDALFLLELPIARLATVYGLMAALALVAVPAGGRLARRLGRRGALGATLALSALGATGFMAASPGPGMAIALYLWTGLVGTLASAQFWLLAGQAFDVAQGKRLFGPLAAAGALGALAGAVVASVVIPVLGLGAILPAAATLHALGAVAARGATLATTREPDTTAAPLRPRAATGEQAIVGRRGYVRRLAVLVALSSVGLLAVDYLFKGTITRHVAPSALPSFLAHLHVGVTAASFLFQIAGAGWLVRRSGVAIALCVLPVMLFGGALIAIVAPLAGVLLVRVTDGVLRHSLHRVTAELLWAPVPMAVRDAVRTTIDGVLVRVAQAATALLLLGLAMVGIERPPLMAGVVAVLLAAWLGAALAIRRGYLDQFRHALSRPSFDASQPRHLDLDAAGVLIEELAQPAPARVIAAIQVLQANGRAKLVPALVLHHPDAGVLTAALAAIAVPERRDWQALAGGLLEHADAAVRRAALRSLARTGRLDLVRASPAVARDPWLRGMRAFWAAQDAREPGDVAEVREVLASPSPSGADERAALLATIGEDGDGRWALVLAALLARAPDAAAGAVEAIQRAGDERFLPALIARLAVRSERRATRAALLRLGAPALAGLVRAFDAPATDDAVRVHVPTTIAQFDGPRPLEILLAHLDERGATGFRVVRALARIARREGVPVTDPRVMAALRRNLLEHLWAGAARALLAADLPSLAGELLHALLGEKERQALERAFLLLQLPYPAEDLRALADALGSPDDRSRSQARELLGELSRRLPAEGSSARPLLVLLADDLDEAVRRRRARDLVADLPTDLDAALDALVEDDDPLVGELARDHRSRVEAARAAALAMPPAAMLVSLPPPPVTPELRDDRRR